MKDKNAIACPACSGSGSLWFLTWFDFEQTPKLKLKLCYGKCFMSTQERLDSRYIVPDKTDIHI